MRLPGAGDKTFDCALDRYPLSVINLIHPPSPSPSVNFFPKKLSSVRLPFKATGFSLLELLSVILLVGLLMGLVVLPMNRTGFNLSKAASDISGLLDGARAHAMANNTFVWVEFNESDTGQLSVSVAASKDGTRERTAANLSPLSGVKKFNNIHLAQQTLSREGNLARPQTATLLGAGVILNFDPQGVARIQSASATDIGQYFEIGLQKTNGTQISTSANIAVIQINCMMGSNRIYAP